MKAFQRSLMRVNQTQVGSFKFDMNCEEAVSF